jgi:PAS domain S-box-containing protein
MILLPFLHFFCFISFVFVAFFVLNKDSKSLLNRTFSILMLCFALWNFGDIILHNPDQTITKGTVEIMQNIASVGWVSFASVILCFSLVFSKQEKLLSKKWFFFLVYSLPLLFFYKQLTNCLTINPIRRAYGWSVEWTDTIWSYLFYFYNLIAILLSIFIIYFYGRKTENINERKQANIFVISIFFSLIIGTIFDIVIQNSGIYSVPPIANLMIFVFEPVVLYAIIKYRFLTITPTIAAENIISVMDEFLILLNQQGIILTANKATTDSLQYEQKELEGKPFAMLFQEDSFINNSFGKIITEEAITNHDSYFQAKNGKIIPILYSSSPVKDNVGRIIGTVFIARDITLRKQVEYQLIKAKEKAEESDRLKTAFLANMSHEIRTPMNGILGFAGLLKEPNLTGNQQQEYLQIIEKGGARLLNIINNIIDISKIESGLMEVDLKESNINDQIEYIYNFYKKEVEAKGIKFSFKNPLPADEAIINTDCEKIYEILTNLVKNAIKFTDKGSIEFGYNKTGKYLEFFVKDTGTGIPQKQMNIIFQRFRQGSDSYTREYEGAGLGLSISKALVEMLGGKIWVKSKEGNGSTFYFTIPCNGVPEEKNVIKKTISVDSTDNQKKDLKILIAEDDEASEKLLIMAVKIFCKEVLIARTGVEAVETCRNNPDIDLVLMDIKMPEMNGYEATHQIRQFNTDVIIISQTAYAITDDREKAIEAGCNDYISKPINKEGLLTLIQKYFNKQ